MVIILELNGINTYHTAKKIKIKMPVPSWKSRSMRDNTGYHTIHGIRPNDFFFENGFNPSPSPLKTAAAAFSFLLLLLLLLLFLSSSPPYNLPPDSTSVPSFWFLCLFFIFLSSTASLYRILNPLWGFYPHNQRSSISFLQLNRCCSESSARCLLVSTRLLYSILKKRYP